MEEGTIPRSLHAVLAIAIGILIVGAGCTATKTEEPPQQSQNETTSSNQANAAPSNEGLPKAAVPFIACYRGEADLFSSTANVSDVWIDQLRNELNNGWLIDVWCRQTDGSGTNQYGFALRRFQGIDPTELASSTFAYEKSGERRGGVMIQNADDAKGWSLIRLAYVAPTKNRSNEIPLQISDAVAVKNEAKPVDHLTILGDINSDPMAPGSVRADVRGGDARGGSFGATFSYQINTKKLVTDEYCRMYFDNEDGSFSPLDAKTECDYAK